MYKIIISAKENGRIKGAQKAKCFDMRFFKLLRGLSIIRKHSCSVCKYYLATNVIKLDKLDFIIYFQKDEQGVIRATL